ncbi:putative divalent heavy-metal cations transporter [Frankia casuarinae]|jgi:zinc transporter ZupT|uniref:Metal cation transporter n=1 Tax=Frankia casuarinae (strain DSM 45818 / CECT 9043 / HFP020203 / CcI3) TaxID=106370 RepID=Q2JA13_FRACC|nr:MULTISPECIES: metal cation transporter [Frankia]ABD11879.1 putative metal cation transporter [Frankia casuarinae]ETA00215.1 putative divalent heavy-metal cations transporter [Frankia sp. CcI6]EYT90503.1 putative divalent heavy-metal cations transporter [Frankia casuarinae]KDA41494.1 putative divalent heavy-metal cations transporter [Frankia sp. BMG5.23]OFB40515.1 hypothetical protein Manayef4_18910 [Frankia sp. CgIM4]
MTSESRRFPEASRSGGLRWRLWALVPITLLGAVVWLFTSTGTSLTGLIRANPPAPDEFAVRRVVFEPGEIRIHVTNPQHADLTIAVVTVDDAIVPFTVDGGSVLHHLRSATIAVPYPWIPEEPIAVGVTSSTGIQTSKKITAAVETPGVTGRSILGYTIIGFLVGVVPIALGLAWLPSLRRADSRWTSGFLALTAGLLTFVAFDALGEAFELQAGLPTSLHGTGVVLFGVAASYLALTFVASRLSGNTGAGLSGATLATLVAIGIGLHNLGEGLAIGSSFALGKLVLGTFLIVGFMIHNITEGLGIAAPLAEQSEVKAPRLVSLALVAGAPAIAGTWIGGFLINDVLGVLFLSIAVGAALQVVVEIGRRLARRAPGGLGTGHVLGGFLAGIAVMYTTGLLTG